MEQSRWAKQPSAPDHSAILTNDDVGTADNDQFAQTREPDNLFDDDFTPITQPATTVPTTTQTHSTAELESQPRETHAAARGRGRGRGRHRGQPDPPRQTAAPESDNKELEADAATPTARESEPANRPTYAARGNRLGTGGVQRPKLTEEELSAKLEAAKLNNARREEAHRAAEADEASFQQREKAAEVKRKEEGVARRAMDMEREKNRMRKLGARGGREWDEGKKEEEEAFEQRRGGYRRGAHGGVVGDRRQDADSFVAAEAPGGAGEGNGRRGRGRGGRDGRRGGRGRGGDDRGGGRTRGGEGVHKANTTPASFTDTDFPALEKRADEAEAGAGEKLALPQLDGADDRTASWADQVEEGT